MCSDCSAPLKSIPVPDGGKIRLGKYNWYVLDKPEGKNTNTDESGNREKGVLQQRVCNHMKNM